MAPHVQDYAVRCTLATHPGGEFATDMTDKYVRWGASPRGPQAVTLAAKVQALLDGRFNTAFSDVQRVFVPAMRHRLLLNFEGEAEGIDTDHVLQDILEQTPTTVEAVA
jgi:MoxR-like ATPase